MSTMPGVDSVTEAAPQAGRPPRRRSGVVLRWVRRVHLYSGLFLLPWVVMYALTAMLFNHPSVWTGQDEFQLPATAERPAARTASAEQLARELVEHLRSTEPSLAEMQLLPESNPRFVGPVYAAAESAEHQYHVTLDPSDGELLVRRSTRPQEQPAFAAQTAPSETARQLQNELEGIIRGGLSQLELPHDQVTIRTWAPLIFDVQLDGETQQVKYDPVKNTVAVAQPLPTRTFFLRLHMTHAYPLEFGPAWVWCLIVDVMFSALIFWAVSGLIMWWQLKALRVGGAVAIGTSLVFFAVLVASMYGSLFQ